MRLLGRALSIAEVGGGLPVLSKILGIIVSSEIADGIGPADTGTTCSVSQRLLVKIPIKR